LLCLAQRVKKASVRVNKDLVSSIDKGILLMVCFEQTDTQVQIDKLISQSKVKSDVTKMQMIAKEVKDDMEKFYSKYQSSDLNYFNVSRAIIVEFLKKIRDEKKFEGLEELKDQIFKDIAFAKEYLS